MAEAWIMSGRKAIVIGGGIGGLATAAVLAKAGYKVDLFEKNAHLGGRLDVLTTKGFRFDMGPSWYLMPEVFEHFFASLGENIHDYLKLKRLDPAYKVFFEGDAPLSVYSDINKAVDLFESIEQGAGKQLRRYVKRSSQLYDLSLKHFLYTNFDSLGSLAIPALGNIAAFPLATHLDSYVSRYFKDRRLKQILEYSSVFLGTSPYRAPAVYNLMSHLDFKQGVFYPKGGLYAVAEAVVAVGKKLGVRYYTKSTITEIISANGQVTGITLANGKQVETDVVVSDAGVHHTETRLLQPADRDYAPSYWKKRTPSSSALLMYLGVRGKLPELTHHNLLFTTDWHKNFGDIEADMWPNPASMYVCAPAGVDPSTAPAGHENLFVLVPGPASPKGDIKKLADQYIKGLAGMIGVPDLAERIVVKELFGPADFAAKFNTWQGAALGLAHTYDQSAFLRPRNRSKKLSNLYYVGADTIPGVGLPMCLISAELVYKHLANDRSAGPLQKGIQAL